MMTTVGVDVPLQPHDLCSIFPDMSLAEYADLMGSIREHGLLEPIVIWEGKILDGRHRYRACIEAGVELRAEEYRGQLGSPEAYVSARNLHHRNLTASQRAAIGVDLKKSLEGKYKERSIANLKQGMEWPEPRAGINTDSGNDSRKEAAQAVGVSEKYISDAERIQEASPEVFEDVKAGKTTITKAKKDLGIGKPKAEPAPEPPAAPEPKAPPKTIVNGEAKEDPAVERLRAAGKIPVDAIVEIEDPGEDVVDVEAIREEREERAAVVEAGQTDDEWLATLPLSTKLEGRALDYFRRDALLYRDLEKSRRSLKAVSEKAVKDRFRGLSFRTTYRFTVERFLGVQHPNAWRKCPATEHGGCGGTGQVELIGECKKCHGGGYLVR